MPGPLDFWKLVKEVNPRGIAEEAARPFSVAAVGTADSLPALRRVAGVDTPAAVDAARGYWVEAVQPMGPDARRAVAGCAFALTLDDAARDVPVLTWSLPDDPALLGRDVKEIMDRFPHLGIALPRSVPLFRREATDRIIAISARTNTEVALASALPGVLPWTAWLLPATALPDMMLLTKNQVMMCLRIAAIYGLPVEPKARIRELGGVVGAAFGWRALAREVVGAVPGGVGAAAKGAIAYAATVATGRAAQAYYETGRTPGEAERKAVFQDALRRGRTVAAETWERIRGSQPAPSPA